MMVAVISEHIETREHMDGTEDRIVRIAVREIREYAFRAMVAHGACTSVAHAAAHQVLFSQVHYGTGFAELLDCLKQLNWSAPALAFERSEYDGGHRYVIDSKIDVAPLMHGTMLIELATAREGNVVVAPEIDLEAGLLDAPLLAAAVRCGKTVMVARLTRGTASHHGTRIATPAGYVGQVRVTSEAFVPAGGAEPGTLIRTLDEVPDDNFALHTPEELVQRRENAWAIGLPVDARLWKTIKAAAEGYLVGEDNA
ncbi:MAG: hypothetical protein L0J68_05975 [Micrococcaceae bacterium]|uniref:hypothetical protein n=1 Tax=Arthrobacter sp. 179 TaxID=3457734 RepID=UPI00264CB0BA|nr:hypothetical protein [Micrococcaceae bacterium]MDN5824525.1 hypothetical protein [Micrococcaceae bacterium]MDN5886911.1 hypothetical protein [Micrococcaceae bacterium]MDN6299821.1 hypothetical protein [Micrococcaceae bacterium]